jgi:5'/3'-nucleotidase SurE
MTTFRSCSIVLALVTWLILPGLAFADHDGPLDLRILLTNDDGFDSEGITALREALVDAGHDVTVVAPATQQSGRGGAINTGVFDFTPGGGTMLLTNYGDQVWSLEGTPSDCVTTALDVVMAGDPPDLIVSGLNEGQNIGKPGSNGSGTIGAALRGLFRGIPSIAGSMEIIFSESDDDFPSTQVSYAPASDFIARAIDRLTSRNGTRIFPRGVRTLNMNFPVPYAEVQGVRVTRLGEGSDITLPHFDPSQGFPAFGIPPIPSFPPCADAVDTGDICFSTVGLGFSDSPDPVRNSDLDALREDFITITPMDGDMTTGNGGLGQLKGQLVHLEP